MKNILYVFLFIVYLSESQGQTIRKYSNEFLKINVGGRNAAMGGSLIGSTEDVTSIFYNPSAISEIENTTIGAMHTSYFAGIANFDYAGIVLPLNEGKSLGVSLLRFGIDNIPNTIELYNPDNTINYDNIRSFSIADYALFVSYAQKIDKIEGLSIGGNAKIIHRTYGSFAKAWGFGFDVGAQLKKEKLILGAFLQDATTTFNSWAFSFTDKEREVFQATENEIPNASIEITAPSIHFGGSYKFDFNDENITVMPSLKFIGYTDQRNVLLPIGPLSIDAALGAEVGFWNTAFLRLGLSNFTKAVNPIGEDFLSMQPSIGLGLHFGALQLNYSYNNVGNAGIGLFSHVVSANFSFK